MSGTRKTPLTHGDRGGLDIALMVREHPQRCRVHFDGAWYMYVSCGYRGCGKMHWHRIGSERTGKVVGILTRALYCSGVCSLAEQKIANVERQKRWKENNPEVWKAVHDRAMARYRAKKRKQQRK